MQTLRKYICTRCRWQKVLKNKVVRRGEEKYNLNNLPRRYIMAFGDISFWIDDDSVEGISVCSPLYKFSNGLGVGDSEQEIKQACGEDFQLEEAEGKDFLTYEDKGLHFEIHKKNRTVMEITVNQTTGNHADSDAPNSGKAIMLSEQLL